MAMAMNKLLMVIMMMLGLMIMVMMMIFIVMKMMATSGIIWSRAVQRRTPAPKQRRREVNTI